MQARWTKSQAWQPEEASHYPAVPADLTLQQVLVLVRHGDRCPISPKAGGYECSADFWSTKLPDRAEVAAWNRQFPVDGPAEAIDATSAPWGCLTSVGAAQCLALGEALRHTYGDALRVCSARATNIRRTQQTAQNVLRGVFLGDGGTGEVGAVVSSAPTAAIPGTIDALAAGAFSISVRDWLDETLVPNTLACPRLRTVLRAAPRPAETPLRRRVAEALGYDASSNDGRGFRIDQVRHGSCARVGVLALILRMAARPLQNIL